jgi:hypothetical protein
MGLDAVIQIRGIQNTQTLDYLNHRIASVSETQELNSEYGNYFIINEYGDAEFQTLWRYWGPGYERGPWFNISGVLMTARGMTGLDIRYGSNANDEPEIMTDERFSKYWQHFCGPNGNHYRNAFHTAQSLMMNWQGVNRHDRRVD